MKRDILHVMLGLLLVGILGSGPLRAEEAKLIEVKKIWDSAPHNAFTDLTRFKNRWYCVFREGKGHVSPDGALRVLQSEDGKTWTSAALITSENGDLRDAKITVTPDGKLMLAGASALHQPSDIKHQSLVWFSDDGQKWSEAVKVGDPNFWLWRITWHQGNAYGIGYATAGKQMARLYKSEDGRNFETLVDNLFDVGYPNETSIVFLEDNTALCLLRRDGKPNSALLGKASPPYTSWNWQELGLRVGGPHMLLLPDGRLIAVGRDYTAGATTRLWLVDPDKPALKEMIKFPSGGDTSYPGPVWHDGLLWVSYYSSHEGKTSIYLAKVQLPEKQK